MSTTLENSTQILFTKKRKLISQVGDPSFMIKGAYDSNKESIIKLRR
jgi:hypothetical protein